MRPPQKAGGNSAHRDHLIVAVIRASMRPPQKAGGNGCCRRRLLCPLSSFNEAPAKSREESGDDFSNIEKFCASMRPPQKAGGNAYAEGLTPLLWHASMRPPQKAGGNGCCRRRSLCPLSSFNEAPAKSREESGDDFSNIEKFCASMRPPQKAGGNAYAEGLTPLLWHASMRPPQKAGGNWTPRNRRRTEGGASMRPPQKAGGNRTAVAWTVPARRRFNEAPAKSRGEFPRTTEHGWRTRTLQ